MYPGGGSALATLLSQQASYLDPTVYPTLDAIYGLLHDWQAPSELQGLQSAEGTDEANSLDQNVPEWSQLGTAQVEPWEVLLGVLNDCPDLAGDNFAAVIDAITADPFVADDLVAALEEAGCASGVQLTTVTIPGTTTYTTTVGGDAPVIPGTFGTDVSLASNPFAPIFETPEFNPSIAVNPTDALNVIEGQFDVSSDVLDTGIACSLTFSTDGGATYSPKTFLPLANPDDSFSICTRALVAFGGDGTAYVLYTDYEFVPGPGPSFTEFRMVMSTDGGATWTDLAGNGFADAAFDPVVKSFPLAQELPILPSLAVTGSGATTRLNIVYSTFKGFGLDNEIDMLASNDAGATFPVSQILRTQNPLIPFPGIPFPGLRLVLAPSNAFDANGAINVVWYDSFIFPGFGLRAYGAYHGANNGAGAFVEDDIIIIGPEFAPVVRGGMFRFPTYFPHIASEFNSGMTYMIWSRGLPFIDVSTGNFIFGRYRITFVYDSDSDITTLADMNLQNNFENPGLQAVADQFYPALAPQTLDGTIHVTWADVRGPRGAGFPSFTSRWQILYSASNPALLVPGAESWTSPLVVSDGQADPPFSRTTFFLGTFFSATASDDRVHPAWTERSPNEPTGDFFVSLFWDDTFTDRGTKPPVPVGGTALSADLLTLALPYIFVAVLATLGLAYVLRKRYSNVNLPQIPTLNW